MRALIVDDERPARQKLRRMLSAFHDVEVAGEARNGIEALALVEQLDVDVLFLDVQMPEADGFDVAASLPDGSVKIVFVTAFDYYALRAFDVRATDYLLKPVETQRLCRTVQRLRESARDPVRQLANRPTRLIVTNRGQTRVIACAEIDWMEASGNYVSLHLSGRVLLMRRALVALLTDLGDDFVRVHRSAAVALSAVVAVRPLSKGDAVVVLRDGEEIACSRQYRVSLMERL
ncbi:LytR/AlgR family response regulator transcription factor [Paraburkholderia megapolitana]|uniref:Two component transcriptional regulator, LytTR family n=1 Tax=Paraburkholderia megapolitana TaxID=420953 RepID=A0A1I3MWT7_9BURK|nr:response regulator [Paraburkholderia megapolitana]QDQ84158.1 response regulator [Paraburkholderia megapolitana]SFJ01240.1 two component transcriptional regulator, LytTR family [Paraburkholderia megapolitana]